MSAVQAIRDMGLDVRLGSTGGVVLVGLDRLQRKQAESALEYARRNKQSLKAELEQRQYIPTMSTPMVSEGMTWPPETQRLWGAVREWFEWRGYQFFEAGALAFGAVQGLVDHHGPQGVAIH